MRLNWLRRFLPLENGIASHDTFGRVFRLLDPKRFELAFRSWISHVVGAAQEHIAIDGKCVRGSHNGEKRAIHLVSAYANRLGVMLCQQKVDDKSNEIDAIPGLLPTLALKGCLVSIDAMSCQREIARAIRERGGHYLLAVKGNQEKLFNALSGFFGATERGRIERLMPECYVRTIEKDHGRIEERRYWLTQDVLKRVDTNAWPDCHQIGMVEAICHTGKGEPSMQRRYFITSAQCDVKDFARAVRDHWRIENSLHWSLDVTFLEDACRVRKDHAAHNYATLRRFALNLIKLDISLPKTSVRSRVKRAEWDEVPRVNQDENSASIRMRMRTQRRR
ncbi:ISAs1 family transposase [Trinickia acidisoli]|uniref:ISAs1 family transposase n=1 Tax=Trinickia acidisoli TaxID=2767482 RepID=UPI001A8C6BBD|nr:ISAs1 family transposase [Trinickia acidisoli]